MKSRVQVKSEYEDKKTITARFSICLLFEHGLKEGL